jgi:hypothetical protein
MLTQITNYAVDAANDQLHKRERTVPISNTITAVAGYPNKLVVFKIAASKFWQVRCFVAGRTHILAVFTAYATVPSHFDCCTGKALT